MRRVPELIALSHDHHSALVLARRCKQSALPAAKVLPAEAWRQVREAFPVHLELHFVIEERFLLPALEEIGESAIVERIRSDHAAMRTLAADAAAGTDAIARFGLLLEAHVRFEEREVFDVAQQRLAAAVLEEIADACRRIPRTPPPA